MPIGKNIGKVTLKYWENVRPLMPDGNKRTYTNLQCLLLPPGLKGLTILLLETFY